MAIEIERRYLVVNDSWIGKAAGIVYRQGYLYFQKDGVVRIRIAGDEAFLTLKVRKDDFNTLEYEYEIPIEDAEDMLERLCDRPPVEKKRYRISHAGMLWEVDEFSGDNEGLLIAEIELEYEKQMFDIPSWVGREVTGEKKYLNAYLYRNPYKNWPSKEKRRQK